LETRSGHEPGCADWFAAGRRSFGLEVDEDGAGATTRSDAGNLLARVNGAGAERILICAHLDTVPLAAPVEPVIVDGGWTNANEGILGADNKAAVAVALALAQRLAAAPDRPRVGPELLFTV